LHFRPNRVADVAKVWLQMMQPWRETSDFLVTAQDLGKDASNLLITDKDALNLKVYTVLSHTSIASLSPPFDLFALDEDEIREKREKWQSYIREFSVFYFDLFVEFIQALILQGSYTIEDAQVFKEVIGKFIMNKA
jgi:hypothetical protein